jgi:hypothetical protein
MLPSTASRFDYVVGGLGGGGGLTGVACCVAGDVSLILYVSVGLPFESAFVKVRVSITEHEEPVGVWKLSVCVVSFEKTLFSIVPSAPPNGIVTLMLLVSGIVPGAFPFAGPVGPSLVVSVAF